LLSTTTTVHSWILDAVKDRTSQGSIDNNSCIRVTYEDNYHIDLVCCINLNNVPFIAKKSEG
jgi:hypothetical protein